MNNNWIDREIMKQPESKFTMEQVFAEQPQAVEAYVVTNLTDQDKLVLGAEFIQELTDQEQAELKELTDQELLETMDWKEVADWVFQGVSARELGDNLGMDWQGLAEEFGIK